MRNILIIVLFILAFGSCKKETYNELTDEDLKWVIYEMGDMLRFQNNNGAIDTFIVHSKLRGYVQSGKRYDEFAQILLYKTSDSLPGNKTGELKVMKTSDGFFVSLRFPHHPQESVINNLPAITVDTINGLPYYNIFISQADTLNAYWAEPVVQVWYSKESGFVRFTDLYGNSWEILN